ncbi:MAG: hypothetical protein CME16_05515 [Gemmatimonadetes bacterium]|nr:hypothetical protein [Gemmatimonadota bacterium]
MKSEKQSQKLSSIYPFFLVLTAFCCGSLIMVIEVLGSRVIGPFFGVSLFVWTSLIAVAMISLAGGYAAGGLFADRHADARFLYGIIFLAGVAVLPIPFLKIPVLKVCVDLGLRTGAFVSALVLFGPSLFLLGCVSPFLIKIAAREVSSIGRTVGMFYAVSTIGSVCGTVLTGFVLIAHMGVSRIFLLVGCLLILLAALYFVFFRRALWAASAVFLLAVFWVHDEANAAMRTLPNGALIELLAHEDSYYGNVKVVQYSFGKKRNRELIIDGLVQGGIDVATGLSYYPYNYYLQHLPLHINPKGSRCLVIGLGAGIIPRWYEARGIVTDAVDIDPAVVRMARDYFDFSTSGTVFVQDARFFLTKNKTKYDYIILDVFNGDTTPSHVISLEAFELIGRNLTDNGVLGINLVTTLKGRNLIGASIVKTLRQVFDQVDLIPLFDPDREGSGNVAVLAYFGDKVAFSPDLFAGEAIHPFARKRIASFRQFAFESGVPAMVLRDDYNPMDSYDLELKEANRRDILQTTDWEILAQ